MLRLLRDHEVGQLPIGGTPGVEDLRGRCRPEHLLNRTQQIFADNGIVFRLDLKADVFALNPLKHFTEELWVDVLRIGQNCRSQTSLLRSIPLICRVEQVVQFWVGLEHVPVENPGDGLSALAQHGHSCYYDFFLRCRQHGR